MTFLAFLTVSMAESKVSANLYIRNAMIRVADRDTPAQLHSENRLAFSFNWSYLPVNENFSTLIHSVGDPLHDLFEVPADVLRGRVLNIEFLILEVLGEQRVHTAHSLDDVRDAWVFKMVQTFGSLDVTNIELRNDHGHMLRHFWYSLLNKIKIKTAIIFD